MKLIIDIDEDSYKEIKKIVADGNDMFFTDKLIANGIPLDDVKAEFINLYPKNYMDEPAMDGMVRHFTLNKVFKILDSIGKESEG